MNCLHNERSKCKFRTKSGHCKQTICQHDHNFTDIHGHALAIGDRITQITRKYGKATRKGIVVYDESLGICMRVTGQYRGHKLHGVEPYNAPLMGSNKYRSV